MAIRIYLLGFMGAGKSYVGRDLASRLHLNFLDLDSFIENSEGKSIAAIFSTKGEPYFRKKEAEYLRQTVHLDRVVIATGGGTPCYFNNLAWMNENGLTLFLDTCEEVLRIRLMESRKRPLVAGKSAAELTKFIHEKLAARRPFYEGAQIGYETLSPEQNVVAELYSYLMHFVRD